MQLAALIPLLGALPRLGCSGGNVSIGVAVPSPTAPPRGEPAQLFGRIENAIRVSGQPVRTDDRTIFGDGLESVSDVTAGMPLAVSGYRATEGAIAATRIDLADSEGPGRVVGAVSSLDYATATFHIDALTVDYSGAIHVDVDGGLPEDLEIGAEVIVDGRLASDGTTMLADVVRIVRSAESYTTGSIDVPASFRHSSPGYSQPRLAILPDDAGFPRGNSSDFRTVRIDAGEASNADLDATRAPSEGAQP